jgi:hypothetical protein
MATNNKQLKDEEPLMTTPSLRPETVALQLVLFTGENNLAPQHIMQIGVHFSALFDAPPALMPISTSPPQVIGAFSKLDGSESLRFEPGKIIYMWERQSPERPAVDVPTALDALVQIASIFEGFGVTFSDVALSITTATRLPAPPSLLNTFANAAPLFADAAEVELRWRKPAALTTWQQGHHWQRITTTSIDYPDGADTPTLLHEQEVNTFSDDDTIRALGAPLIAQFFEEATKLMHAAEALAQQQFTPRADIP